MAVLEAVTHVPEGVPLLVPSTGMSETYNRISDRTIAGIDVALEAVYRGDTETLIFSGHSDGRFQYLYDPQGTVHDHGVVTDADRMFMYAAAALGEDGLYGTDVLLEGNSSSYIQKIANSFRIAMDAELLDEHSMLAITTDESFLPHLTLIARKLMPAEIDVVPVLTGYRANIIEKAADRASQFVTTVALFGLRDGAGFEKVIGRDERIHVFRNEIRAQRDMARMVSKLNRR